MKFNYSVGTSKLLECKDDHPLHHLGVSIALCVTRHVDVFFKDVKVYVEGDNISKVALIVRTQEEADEVMPALKTCPIVKVLNCAVTVKLL
jgi:hypothetical protein